MNVLLEIYLIGYRGYLAPRWLRKLCARTAIHRAWFCGYKGIYVENGKRYRQENRVTHYTVR